MGNIEKHDVFASHASYKSYVTPNPLLEISIGKLRKSARTFLTQFPGETSYAVKANSNSDVIKTLYEHGIYNFDVASLEEMQLVQTYAPNSKMHYHNPVRSTEEIKAAYHIYDCRRFAVDHIDELLKIYSAIPSSDCVEIAVRFANNDASQAVMAFKSKFGADTTQATRIMRNAKAYGFTVGLTFHPGSQTSSPQPYKSHIAQAKLISNNAGITPAFVNVGGGFPAYYAQDKMHDLGKYFSTIRQSMIKHFGPDYPKLECEPGRAMVASSGTLITRVKSVRRDSKELFINDGIYGALMEVHQFPKLQPMYDFRDTKEALSKCLWTVYGPTCDPIDVLPFKLSLPEKIEEGDTISFYGLGAYSLSTATRFNGYGNFDIKLTQ